MSRRDPRALLAAALLALGVAACGGGSADPVGAGTTPGGAATTPGASASTTPGTGAPSPGPTALPSTPWPSPSPGVDYLNPTSSPTPFSAPWTPEVPVDAVVSPACVRPGGRATVTVKTEPKSAVAYHAMYAGSRGGAPPPFGSGYGGNDKGIADDEGRYGSSWVVSPQAPPGPARLDVVVAGHGDRWGYDDPPFRVADSSGRC